MKKYINIKKIVLKFCSLFKSVSAEIKSLKKLCFRVEEIDLNAKVVVMRCQGTCTIIKLSLAEAISDHVVISSLSSYEACWLGYYYAKSHRVFASERNKLIEASNRKSFLLCFFRGRYKITSQDRNGNVTYIDVKTKKIFTDSPQNICKNEHIISQFDPTQACYIGILAANSRYDNVKSSSKIKLRLVE